MSIKVMHIHNYYLQAGGEDTAFSAEVALLRDRGHDVVEYTDHNRRITTMSQFKVATETLWSRGTFHKISELLEREKPQVAHFHNIFPLISPAAYYACQKANIPVIQSLDNPRLLCPSANFYRDGRLCQDCLGKTPPLPSIVHGCYHASRLHTSVVVLMLTLHRWLKTWNELVNVYLVATQFYRDKFIEGGLPAGKIEIKPHFIYPDPGARTPDRKGTYALFIARLDPEKGIRTMLQAWKKNPNIPLKIRGEGQLEKEVRQFVANNQLHNIEIVPRLSKLELTDLIKNARFLVWPSEGYYETFGYVAVESFSCGIPVIASNIGVLGEVVRDGVLGLHFAPGDSGDLASKVQWAWDHPEEMTIMGRNARQEYEDKYTADKNYEMLMAIYERAITTHHAHR